MHINDTSIETIKAIIGNWTQAYSRIGLSSDLSSTKVGQLWRLHHKNPSTFKSFTITFHDMCFSLPIFSTGSWMLWLSIEMQKFLIEQLLYTAKINFSCLNALIRLFAYHAHVLKSSLECTQVVLKISWSQHSVWHCCAVVQGYSHQVPMIYYLLKAIGAWIH